MRRTLTVIPLVLSAALLAGCASASDSGAMSVDGMGAPAPMQEQGAADSSEAFSQAEERDALSVSGPQIITNVDLTVTVTKPLTAADDAAAIASRFGGSVSYRSENAATEHSPGSAQLTLRIPSAKLTQALEEIKELGTARDTSIYEMDVTAQSQDLTARITALQTSVDRLLTLMSQATSTENLLAVESALSERQANLESLQSQKRNLDDQVQLSTVNLYLVSEKDTPAADPDTFWTGLVTGWNAFVGFWAAVVVALGVVAPWLIAAGLITAIVLIWVRLARRRKATTKEAEKV